ncbi:MFS transporter [Corynebacterium poyangense]|uniref:MFS transporter n=1 Tax=Corynebacterium poyangense TaxID=2684405 RepID=A0A7H0SRM6_9CORY|nr:aromatic acid/H+ symport family MFS transporter [Corynebacterium poyangense]MBZ8176632.1 MFS transporter [Corynebacterium poyangense]QNQ91201.1 MFS transporter [Corynebacterium poyangense]
MTEVIVTPQIGEERDKSSIKRLSFLGVSGSSLVALLVCWVFVIFDGYDLIVYGTVQTSLAREWNLTNTTLGTIGSTAFLGMALGAIFIGRISDLVGRKKAVLLSVVILSVFTVCCAFAPNPWFFGGLRFVAGLGLGGLVPSVNALTAEVAPRRTMSAWATLMMSGVPLGGSLAALLGTGVVPSHPEWGWRIMFLVAVIPLAVGIPLAMKYLPKDLKPDANKKAAVPESSGFKDLLGSKYRTISLWFALATFVTLFAWYGLGTWLPRLMETAGYDLGAALLFTLALNIGAIIGSGLTAWAGDRFGPLQAGIIAAFIAGVALCSLLVMPPVWAVYLILICAGVGTHGSQILIIAAIANGYPGSLRGTALGWALGTGRIGAVVAPQLAGLFLGWGFGVNSNFILFGFSALLSSFLMFLVLRKQLK